VTEDDDPLYRDPAFARLYDLDNAWGPDLDACVALADGASSVLDLGCGTGRLARRLAAMGKRVTAVDPARAMIDVARDGAGAGDVEWIVADARDLDLGRGFDLVTMTGHVFQVFLTPADRLAALRTIRRRLARSGRFVFDVRNPAREEWRDWRPRASRRVFDDPGRGEVTAWNDVVHDPVTGVVTYQTGYRAADGGPRIARSRIAFPDRAEVARHVEDAGLAVLDWWGDWERRPFTADADEIVAYGCPSPRPPR
jgi:SAM-dependent methyltransferase